MNYEQERTLSLVNGPPGQVEPSLTWKTSVFQLQPRSERRFERVHRPACRDLQDPKQLPLVIEQVALEFDELDRLNLRLLSREVIEAKATPAPNQENIMVLELTWPAATGEFIQPEKDPRQKWGPRFGIDIPFCKR